MSAIANMPKVKEALDNLREVLEMERRDRIEFLRSCISSWKEEIARAEKLPEQIARSEAEIAELERMTVPTSLAGALAGDRPARSPAPIKVDAICPGCRKPVPIQQLYLKPDESMVPVVLCDACRACRLNAEEYNKQFGVCPDCGKKATREELAPAPCPFELEVNGNKTPFSMCNACRTARADDV